MQRIHKLLADSNPVTWLFYGDSITHGAYHTHGMRDYTQVFNERIRHELGRALDAVVNTATSGQTTRELLATYDRRVTHFRPDVVSIMIGMNDCFPQREVSLEQFAHNLRQLCAHNAELGAVSILQTSNTIVPHTAPDREQSFAAYMDVIRDVASECNCLLIDQAEAWESNAEIRFGWMNDGFHPNGYGHLFMAHVMFKALGIFDAENSPVCKHFLPNRGVIQYGGLPA